MSKFLRIVESSDPTIDQEEKEVLRDLFNDAHVADVTYRDRIISIHFKEGGTLKLKFLSLKRNEEDEGEQLAGQAIGAIMSAPKPKFGTGFLDPAAKALYQQKQKLASNMGKFVDRMVQVLNKASIA